MIQTTLPHGWKRIPISETWQGLFDGPHATPAPSEDGPVFLGIGNIADDGHLDLSDVRHISEADYSRWTKRVEPRAGDIVFTYEATLNRYAIIPEGFRGCLGRRLALIRPNGEKVDTRFLFYTFFSADWRSTIERNRLAGATVDRIPIAKFPDFPINLPPLPIQHRIADFLSAYDALIAINARRIAILEEMAQRLFDEWFVRLRFPGRDGLTNSAEFGLIPKNSCVISLDAVMDFEGGTQPPKEEWAYEPADGFVRMIQIRDYQSDKYVSYVPDSKKLRKCNSKDIMIARYGASVARICWGLTGAYNVALVRVIPHEPCFKEFLRIFLKSGRFQELLIGMSGRTAQAGFNKSVLKGINLVIPNDRSSISKFEMIVAQFTDQILLFKQQSNLLRLSRDLLLPKIISGDIDFQSVAPDTDGAVAQVAAQ